MTDAASPLETGELTQVEVRLDAMFDVGRDVAILAEYPDIDLRSKNKAVAAGARETFLTGKIQGKEVLDGYKEGSSSVGSGEKLRQEVEGKGKGAPPFTLVDPSADVGKQVIKVYPGRLKEIGRVIGQWGEECAYFNPKTWGAFYDMFERKSTAKLRRFDPMFGEAAKFRRGLRDKGDSSGLLLFDTILSGFMTGMKEAREPGKPVPLIRQ